MKTNAWIGDLVSQLRVIRAWSRVLRDLEHLPLAKRLRSDAFKPFLEASWIPNISTLEGQLADLTNARFDALISRLPRRFVAANSKKPIPLAGVTGEVTKCMSEEEQANGEAVSSRDEVGIPNGLDPDTLVRAWVGQFRAWQAWMEQDKAITQAQEEKRTARQSVLLAACEDLGERLKQANLAWWNPLGVIPTPGRQALFQEVQLAFPHLKQYVSEVSGTPVERPAPGDDWVPKLLQELASTLRPNQEGPNVWSIALQNRCEGGWLKEKGDSITKELRGGVWPRALALTAFLGLEACGDPLEVKSVQGALDRFLQRLVPDEWKYFLREQPVNSEDRSKEKTQPRVPSTMQIVLGVELGSDKAKCRHSSRPFTLPQAPGLLRVARDSAREVLERLGFGEPFPGELESLLECHDRTEAILAWKPLQKKHWPTLGWYLQRLCLLLDTTPEGRLAAANLLGAFEELGFRVVLGATPDNGNGLMIDQPGGAAQPYIRLNAMLGAANHALVDETTQLALAWKAWQLVQRLEEQSRKRLRPLADALLGLDYRAALDRAAPNEQQGMDTFFPLINKLFKIGCKEASAKEKPQLDQVLSVLKEWGGHYKLTIYPLDWSFAKPVQYKKGPVEKKWG